MRTKNPILLKLLKLIGKEPCASKINYENEKLIENLVNFIKLSLNEFCCQVRTYNLNFSPHFGLSVAALTDVARMNLAGSAACRLSRWSRMLLLLPPEAPAMMPVAPLAPLMLPRLEPFDPRLLCECSLRLKLMRKLVCFFKRSIWLVHAISESRRSSWLAPNDADPS